MDLGESLKRSFAGPIDPDSIFESYDAALTYVQNTSGTASKGMTLSVNNGSGVYELYTVSISRSTRTLNKVSSGTGGGSTEEQPPLFTEENVTKLNEVADTYDSLKSDVSDLTSRVETLEDQPASSSTAPNKFYVLAVAGQSNSVGYDESPVSMDGMYYTNSDPTRIKQISGRVGSTDEFVDLGRCALSTQNMNLIGNKSEGTKGIHLPIANLILPHIPKDYGLVIVPVAWGMNGLIGNNMNIPTSNTGSANGSWRSDGGKLYELFLNKVDAAMNQNEANKFLGVVWCEGEADKGNAETHKTRFAAMTEHFFNHMTTSFPGRSATGVYNKTIWYNHSTTHYWYASPNDCTDIFNNYKEWNEATFVDVGVTTTNETNQTNGDGRTSSARNSHFGNNAFARIVAPAVYSKMKANGLLGSAEKLPVVETSTPDEPVAPPSGDVNVSTEDLINISTNSEFLASLTSESGMAMATNDDFISVPHAASSSNVNINISENGVASFGPNNLVVNASTNKFNNSLIGPGIRFKDAKEFEFKTTRKMMLIQLFRDEEAKKAIIGFIGANNYYITVANGAWSQFNNNVFINPTANGQYNLGDYIRVVRKDDGDVAMYKRAPNTTEWTIMFTTLKGLSSVPADLRSKPEFGLLFGFASAEINNGGSNTVPFAELKIYKEGGNIATKQDVEAMTTTINDSLFKTIEEEILNVSVAQGTTAVEGGTDLLTVTGALKDKVDVLFTSTKRVPDGGASDDTAGGGKTPLSIAKINTDTSGSRHLAFIIKDEATEDEKAALMEAFRKMRARCIAGDFNWISTQENWTYEPYLNGFWAHLTNTAKLPEITPNPTVFSFKTSKTVSIIEELTKQNEELLKRLEALESVNTPSS